MKENNSESFGANLKQSRVNAGMTQSALARQSEVNRLKIVRMESEKYSPTWEEVSRIAQILRVPIQQFLSGKQRPSISLKGIAFELNHLGIRDYVVEEANVPGAFRRPEQIIAIALRGNRPETRLVDAMPLVMATHTLNVGLALAFADLYDRRVRARLAWLCDVTLALGRLKTFPVPIRSPEVLEKLTKRVKKPKETDDLGYPSSHLVAPLWRRWNISYGGTMKNFLDRARDLSAGHRIGEDE